MPKCRLLVLGVDCLDYGLVHRWRMREYIVGSTGFHFVGYDLYTPVIWAKILTGLDVTRHGFSSKTISRRKRLRSLYYVASIASRLLGRSRAGDSGASSAREVFHRLVENGFRGYESLDLRSRLTVKLLAKAAEAERLPARLVESTVIAYAEKQGLRVRAVEFPPVTDRVYALIRNMLYFYIGAGEEEKKSFLDYVWAVTEKTLQAVPGLLDYYDVVLWYTPYVDIASHLYYRPRCLRCMLMLRAAYQRLARLLGRVLRETPPGTEVVVVSDHGYNPRVQDHSHYGYWSTTRLPGEPPARAEDVARLLRGLIRGCTSNG